MIIFENDLSSLSNKLAELFHDIAIESIHKNGRFNVALCGGSTPRLFHQTLAMPPYNSEIPWGKVHLFWVDDRCVSKDSPDSNFGNVKRDLIDKIEIPNGQVYPMDGELPPDQGAKSYESSLIRGLKLSKDDVPVFDLIFLGVGEDGHVASLFPGSDEFKKNKWVVAVKGGIPNVFRLTLTYPVLNHSMHIIFLASGKSKAKIVHKIFKQPDLNLPAQRVYPPNGKITWVMDMDAASLLESDS